MKNNTKKRLTTKQETVRFTVTMFPDMKTRLDRMGKKQNKSLSLLITEAVRKLLEK